jgi:O-antigen ligase
MEPWLIAATATLLLWIALAREVTRRHLALAVAVAALLATVGRAAPPVLLAIGGLVVMAASAAVAAASDSRRWIRPAIVNGWLIAALASSVLALAQYFGLSSHLTPWVNSTGAGEAFANLRQRNQFATLTSIGLVALLYPPQQGSRLSWAVPAAGLLAAANAASASRTGVLQIGLIVALTFWWIRPMQRRAAAVCVTAALAYGLAAFALPYVLQHLSGVSAPNAFGRLISADGCASRAVLWSNVLHLIAQKPWWGWGWGELDYAHFATLYAGPRFCDILDNAHNLPLQLAVELGVPVALLACAGFFWWLVRQRPWSEPDATRRLAWSVVAVILLHSLLEYPLWYGPFQMAFGFSLGLLARRPDLSPASLLGPRGRSAVSALLALALLYTAWDYHWISQLYTPPEERSALHRTLPRIGDSWLFRDQLAFAELSLTPLTRENAATVNALALELLHYSPEPRVIDSAIESAMWIGREDQALWLLARLRAAFPEEAAAMAKAAAVPGASGPQIRH